ncbi:MAG TPA: pseudouridine-5'-phosphate glycosidase [Pyrinomonadaceae bacterium]|jgi:pseudouridine-5'-phosphate glycosidase
MNTEILRFNAEVASELSEQRAAIVALESTVIAHGLPRPRNLETALHLEAIIRECGATPATIAVIKGQLHVGLERAQLDEIANNDDVHKLSRRDLPLALANNWNGATTVATTAWIAEQAGIRVFATGGIGGVHRGSLPDVSADLPELARSSLTVVCSGAKIVLDLEATREWLETYGITVVGFGCDEMPAFYSRLSGLPVDARVETFEEAARIAQARRKLGLEGATLVTVPVPAGSEIPAADFKGILAQALSQADAEKIAGRDLTPFLLSRMAADSHGATLEANIALLENNARVAAGIALALSQL